MTEHIRVAARRWWIDQNPYLKDNDLLDIAEDIVGKGIVNISNMIGKLELVHRRGVLPREKMDKSTKALMSLIGRG